MFLSVYENPLLYSVTQAVILSENLNAETLYWAFRTYGKFYTYFFHFTYLQLFQIQYKIILLYKGRH